MELGEEVWSVVEKWNYFQKDTIGKQMVRAADSIAANLSEGFGRHHFRESINFSYYSRGSLYETKPGSQRLTPEIFCLKTNTTNSPKTSMPSP